MNNQKAKSSASGGYVCLGILVLCLLSFGGCTAVKWVGMGTYVGTVQRAYEKADVYRVEFITLDGDTRVFENAESSFPVWKSNTADLQAVLKKAEQDGSEVEITTWGWRSSITSSFPNVVDLEVKESDQTQKLKAKIATILEELLQEKVTVEQATDKIEKTTRSR